MNYEFFVRKKLIKLFNNVKEKRKEEERVSCQGVCKCVDSSVGSTVPPCTYMFNQSGRSFIYLRRRRKKGRGRASIFLQFPRALLIKDRIIYVKT
jgi:hypothetical protein